MSLATTKSIDLTFCGVLEPGAKAARALIEIAGVLVKDRLRHYMANQNAANAICVQSPETFGIAFRSLAELGIPVPRLLDSRADPAGQEYDRIDDFFPAELKFLCGCQRRALGW